MRIGELGALDIQKTSQSGSEEMRVLARRYDEDTNEVFTVDGSDEAALSDAVARAVEYLRRAADA